MYPRGSLINGKQIMGEKPVELEKWPLKKKKKTSTAWKWQQIFGETSTPGGQPYAKPGGRIVAGNVKFTYVQQIMFAEEYYKLRDLMAEKNPPVKIHRYIF